MSAQPISGQDARYERACLVALSSLVGLGPATVRACATTCGAAAAWDALRSGRGRQLEAFATVGSRTKDTTLWARIVRGASVLDAEAVLARHEAAGQRVVAYGEAGYPQRLLGDHAPPAVLFLSGSVAALEAPTVAIVGTRNATRLGRDTAADLAAELASRGVSIVSGLALGIDGAAHEAVVGRVPGSGCGAPVGVIATGLERAYPRRHQLLQQQVASTGLLVSESPLGSEPLRWRFPARNRIIAGLADAVVVVESRSAGGSMLTASEALARDRTVLAVPGHPTSPSSAGTLDLIADGAVPVRDVTDVLVALGLGGRKPVATDPVARSAAELSETAGRLLDELGTEPRTLGELLLLGPWGIDEVSLALLELEQAGCVERSGAWFERSRPAGARVRTGPHR